MLWKGSQPTLLNIPRRLRSLLPSPARRCVSLPYIAFSASDVLTLVCNAQAPGPITIVRQTLAKDGFIGLYSGCGALVAGNAVKAGVRFLSYDHFKTMLKDENGKLSGPRSLLAGLGAGMMEAIFAVTPSETIKTKLIDDAKRAVPKYPPGLVAGTTAIVKEEGMRGIYRGLGPVMMRQGANSAVRFGTYSTLKNFVAGSQRPGQSLPGGITFGIGAVAGIVTVCKSRRTLHSPPHPDPLSPLLLTPSASSPRRNHAIRVSLFAPSTPLHSARPR